MASPIPSLPRSLLLAALVAILALLAIAALRGGGLGAGSGDAAAGPRGNLEGASIGGPFRMVDDSGDTVTEASWPGQWRLYYFGFTSCPDICPTDVGKLAQALTRLEERDPARARRLQPLFVSVDPERDTPALLAEFTDAFHPRLVGLTGSPDDAAAMRRAFRVYAEQQPGATPDDYLVDHMAIYYLFDPDNRPVAFLNGMTASPDDILAMIDAHVR